MINFIDISSWQGDIPLANLDIDAVVIKATEATEYVNPYCDIKVQEAKLLGLPWGFYHFFSGDGYAEADYFVDNCLDYFGQGIPILDWEDDSTDYQVNRFIERVHERTGLWCWVYSNPWRFNLYPINENCMRWIAYYPSHLVYPDFTCDEGEPPECKGLVGAWQFASDGVLNGYDGLLDLNRFYGTKESWLLYAGGAKAEHESIAHHFENDSISVDITMKK